MRAEPVKRHLQLLVQELDAHDVEKLAVFLRLGRHRLACDWEIVSTGEAHVLVYGGSEPDTLSGLFDDPLEMRRISDAAGGPLQAAATLLRPLQYELVIDTLLDAERKSASPDAPPPVVAFTPPLAATQGPLRGPDPVSEPPSAPLQAGARYRLKRWPPAAWVQHSRNHLRIASFLSARHIDAEELVLLANIDLAQCNVAIATLLADDLLDVKAPQRRAAPHTTPRATAQATETASAKSRQSPLLGLLTRIRRKLGLGLSP